MSSNNVGNSNNVASPSFATKAGYVGTGILIGLVIYPFVRKALSKIQPQMDKVFDDLTGKAENLAEKGSDLLARAMENMRSADAEETPNESHDEPDHVHSRSQAPVKGSKRRAAH